MQAKTPSYVLLALTLSASALNAELVCDATVSATEDSNYYYSDYMWLDSYFNISTTSSYNFSSDSSISFTITPSTAGTFTYNNYLTGADNTISLFMMFGSTNAGGMNSANYSISFVDASGFTYDIDNAQSYAWSDSPNGMVFSFQISNISNSFTFSSIVFTIDYSAEGADIPNTTFSNGNSKLCLSGYVPDADYDFLTFTPSGVPEPAHYTTFAGLAGLIGAFAWRRRKNL